MALLSSPRRGLAVAILGLLVAPMAAMAVLPSKTVSAVENRVLARAPGTPRSVPDALGLPRRVDAYLSDHFGFRDRLIAVNNRLFGRASSDLAAAVEGKRGRFFLTEGLLRATGREVDPERAERYAAFVCRVSAALKARGAKPIFTIVPSTAAIYPEDAPDLALPVHAPTETDLIFARVRACGVAPIDLRPALWAAKGSGDLYRSTDSHWRETGALTAFNALATGAGRPDWRLDPARAQWTPVTLADGDLPRLAGLPPRPEADLATPYVQPPSGARRVAASGIQFTAGQPFTVETGRAGERLLIVGDSFTEHFFPGFFLNAGLARVGWMHGDECAFDWRMVERFRPDYVLIAPVDRYAVCSRRDLPRNFPRG